MKKLTILLFVALTLIVGPAVADARTAPAGATVDYTWLSSDVQNEISYYGRDGKLIKRKARFLPRPGITLISEPYAYAVRVKAKKAQKVGSRATSAGQLSACTIFVNGRQVAHMRDGFTGKSRC